MCYSNCTYQNSFSGECNNPLKNSKEIDAECNENLICKSCGCQYDASEEIAECELCPDCFIAWDMVQCITCKEYFESEEIVKGICYDCDLIKFPDPE